MSPSWYDVLGVDDDATPEQIRAAWKDSIADLDPTDRRFRQRNRAAEVLLDPQRRAAHDAELADQPDEPDEVDEGDDAAPAAPVPPGPAPVLAKAPTRATPPAQTPATTPAPAPAEPAAGFAGPWLVVALGLLAAVLVVACVVAVTRGGEEPAAGGGTGTDPGGTSQTDTDGLPDAVAVDAARGAAEDAVGPVLAYDYRRLDDDERAATAVMTPDFADQYRQLFAATIRDNAPRTETVVQVELVASGISGTGRGLVDVLLFVDRPTSNIQRSFISQDQVILRMTDAVDGTWRVGCIIAVPRTPGVGAPCDTDGTSSDGSGDGSGDGSDESSDTGG